MPLNYIGRLILLLTVSFLQITCKGDLSTTSATENTFSTAYGTISKLDPYPLYVLYYKTDYKFDEYLQTGLFPISSIESINSEYNYACTCFSAMGDKHDRLLGRNFDWDVHSTYFLLFTEPDDGFASVSMVDVGFLSYDHSKPPDASENDYALRISPLLPFDGMNEAGVAIGMNAVPHAQSPYDPEKVTIGELQFIRLVLDYAGSTDEALHLASLYNIRMEEPPIHYIIADSSGQSAIIEFVGGEMVVIRNSEPWQVTTNFVISDIENPEQAQCWRYQTVFKSLGEKNGILNKSEAMELLQDASWQSTRWSAVYSVTDRDIAIAMGGNYFKVYEFEDEL